MISRPKTGPQICGSISVIYFLSFILRKVKRFLLNNKMTHKYQILYDTLISKINASTNLEINELPILDDDGYDIMYQLYDMFMKKHNLPNKKFIIEEEENKDFDTITFDFKNMPNELKLLLYIFAETHYKALNNL